MGLGGVGRAGRATRTRRISPAWVTRRCELLNTPICRLGLRLEGTILERGIKRLYRELDRAGISLRPRFYLGDEWSTLDRTINVEIKFTEAFASDDLKRLAREFELHLSDEQELMAYLRHEAGHTFCNAHRLYNLPEFKRVFNLKGGYHATYPGDERYLKRPSSKDFVRYLPAKYYAQKHPAEDFAETFATIIDPHSNWRKSYAGWGARQKLQYVAGLIKHYGPKRGKTTSRKRDLAIEEIQETLAAYLEVDLVRYARTAPGFIDHELGEIFTGVGTDQGWLSASHLIGRSRRTLMRQVTRWGGVREGFVKLLIDKAKERCATLDLSYHQDDSNRVLVELAIYLTSRSTNPSFRETLL